MKRSWFVALGLALLVSTSASAVPVLQLDIAGGSYDTVDDTIVTTSDTFTVYAYATPSRSARSSDLLGTTFYLSVALTPETNREGGDYGSFTVNGRTYDATEDMAFGVPPIERSGSAGHDGGDLGSHGVYATHFLEIPFTFSASRRSGEYDTEDDAGQGPIAGRDMYYAAFSVDKSLLDATKQLHFDLYSVNRRSNHDRDIALFAPFSHDAGTIAPSIDPIPEPTAALVFGVGLLVSGISTRRRAAK